MVDPVQGRQSRDQLVQEGCPPCRGRIPGSGRGDPGLGRARGGLPLRDVGRGALGGLELLDESRIAQDVPARRGQPREQVVLERDELARFVVDTLGDGRSWIRRMDLAGG